METVVFGIQNTSSPLETAINQHNIAGLVGRKYPDPDVFDTNNDGKFDSLDIVQNSPLMPESAPSEPVVSYHEQRDDTVPVYDSAGKTTKPEDTHFLDRTV